MSNAARNAIFEISNYGRMNFTSKLAKVTAVNKDEMVCDVVTLEDNVEYPDVLLTSNYSPSGEQKFPMVESIVLVTFLSNSTAFLTMTDELEEYHLKIDTTEFKINKDETVVKKGSAEMNISDSGVVLKNGTETLKKLIVDTLTLLGGQYILLTPSGPTTGPDPSTITQIEVLKSRWEGFSPE